MPITKSAKKALRQTGRRTIANRTVKDKYKANIKAFREAMNSNNMEAAKSLLPKVYQTVDKAVKKGVIKKNAAARYKSRLSTAIK